MKSLEEKVQKVNDLAVGIAYGCTDAPGWVWDIVDGSLSIPLERQKSCRASLSELINFDTAEFESVVDNCTRDLEALA